MKTILIPVDFSENSIVTCKYAIKIAGITNPTTLHFLHIYPDQLMIPDSSFPSGIDSDAFMNVQFIEELRQQSERNMADLVKDVNAYLEEKKVTTITLSHTITGGDPEWEIRNLVDDLKPDIIVMGTHGTGKKGFLEGSMAESIMDHASVPVISVPANIQNCQIRNILYASNGSENDYAKIKLLLTLFKETQVNISVLHLVLESKKDQGAAFMADLKEAFLLEKLSDQVRFYLVDADDKYEALETFVKHQQIDIIAFISHKSNIFKALFSQKLSKKDFFKLELPMLAMHE
ncbi:MAG: universal stress protein [Bacteroidales bacterium]|nr:universal stress protein [Bacteroidales bacterium]